MIRLALLAGTALLLALPAVAQQQGQPPRGQQPAPRGQAMDHPHTEGMDHSRMQGGAPHGQ